MGGMHRTIVATNAVTPSKTQKRPGHPPGRSAVSRGVVIVVSIAGLCRLDVCPGGRRAPVLFSYRLRKEAQAGSLILAVLATDLDDDDLRRVAPVGVVPGEDHGGASANPGFLHLRQGAVIVGRVGAGLAQAGSGAVARPYGGRPDRPALQVGDEGAQEVVADLLGCNHQRLL